MGKRLTLVLTLVLAVAMVGTALTYAGARGFRAKLNDDQRAEIREMVTGMREADATREDIRAAVGEMLEEFGVKLPEDWGQRPRRGDGPFANLNDEQRRAIRAKVAELEEAGATGEQIRTAVGEMLKEFGVGLPEKTGERPRLRRPGLRRLCADLTEDQRAEIREMVTEMREAGTPREEVRAAVRGLLEGYGVKLSEEITPSARVSGTTAVQSAGWGQIKSQFK